MLRTSSTTITCLVASSAAGDSGSRLIKISQMDASVTTLPNRYWVSASAFVRTVRMENETPGIGDHARSKPRAPMVRDTPACRQGPNSQLPSAWP